MKKPLQRYWPIGLLLLVEIILWVTNYVPGSFLVGWDNLYPEINLGLSVKRNLNAVWQEYRGLGLLDGMSHAANLPQDLMRLGLASLLPLNLVRWVYIFGLHFTGGVGVYWLINKLLLKDKKKSRWIALFGAWFYQYNLGIIQTFFLPFEVFIVHYAFLPWLIYYVWRYLDWEKKKDLTRFLVVSILSIPQAHVPTLFIVYFGAVGLVWVGKLLMEKGSLKVWKRGSWLLLVTFLINAFWGIPFAYSTFKNAEVISRAKANQMSTDDIFYRNLKYGRLEDIATLKGFSLDFKHLDYKSGKEHLMMQPWLEHISSDRFKVLAWSWFGLAILGLWKIVKKEKRLMPLIGVFLGVLVLMGTDIPGISWVTGWLRDNFKFFGQVFRFTFTKFSIIYVLMFSLLLSLGISQISEWLRGKWLKIGWALVLGVALSYYVLPSFKGHFFYENLAVEIPEDYFKTFDFLAKQDVNERVVVLPTPWYWAWTQNKWGTIGSGFIWYGIPQSLVDVAFMPWSDENENLYWQLEQAVYSEDVELLESVLDKYDIEWILFDGSIDSSPAVKMYEEDYKDLISQVDGVSLAQTYDFIDIYRKEGEIDLDKYVVVKKDLPKIMPKYVYDNLDIAYEEYGDYIAVDQGGGVYYPFRSLFSGKGIADEEFRVKESFNKIIFLNGDGEGLEEFSKEENKVYDSWDDDEFLNQKESVCGVENDGRAEIQLIGGGLRLSSMGTDNCIKISLPELSHQLGYLIRVEVESITQNRGLRINVFNETIKKSDLDVYLSVDESRGYLAVSPRQQYGLGYTIYISNLSEGREEVVNEVGRVVVYKLPYGYLKQIKLVKGKVRTSGEWQGDYEVRHPNPSYYEVSLDGQGQGTLVLSQAFDDGWLAYEDRLFLGERLENQVLVNNWANGWQIEGDEKKIILFYWPQLLEYAGFLGLVIAIGIVLRRKGRKQR